MADEAKAKTSAKSADKNPKADVTETTKGTPDFVADRVSDLAPTPEAVDAQRDSLNPSLGEELAQKAVEDNSREGGNVEIVEENGVRSAVAKPFTGNSDNGKVYRDERINPRDTNAPDAGLTPDGRRIAE